MSNQNQNPGQQNQNPGQKPGQQQGGNQKPVSSSRIRIVRAKTRNRIDNSSANQSKYGESPAERRDFPFQVSIRSSVRMHRAGQTGIALSNSSAQLR